MEERQKIIDNILEISDENKNAIEIHEIKLEFSCNKYSSKKNSIYHITLNGKHLSKKSTYGIKYKCLTCEGIHVVGVTQFIRKVNKCSYRCYLCCNRDEEKRMQHSKFLKTYVPQNNIQDTKTLLQLKQESVIIFEECDDDFKEGYFRYHLTVDDYIRISKNLVSLQNGKHMVQNLEFWPIFKTNNQMLFSSVFYDKQNDMIVKAHQPIFKCQNCQNEWRAKTIEKFKNCYKILCHDCSLCNKTFKIRNTKNNVNQIVLYQSRLELKFIEWCNNTNLTVLNGPVLNYMFNDKERKYKVDFQIADILIEIKDDHVWHKNEISSGKWQLKENAAKQEIEKGVYKEYFIITPKNWVYSLNKIKQKLAK
jgi:hypothetical protein